MSKKELSDMEIDEIERRCTAARPGPWKSYVEGRDHVAGSNIITVGSDSINSDDMDIIGATPEDQGFIAASRTYFPALIAEVKRLRLQTHDR